MPLMPQTMLAVNTVVEQSSRPSTRPLGMQTKRKYIAQCRSVLNRVGQAPRPVILVMSAARRLIDNNVSSGDQVRKHDDIQDQNDGSIQFSDPFMKSHVSNCCVVVIFIIIHYCAWLLACFDHGFCTKVVLRLRRRYFVFILSIRSMNTDCELAIFGSCLMSLGIWRNGARCRCTRHGHSTHSQSGRRIRPAPSPMPPFRRGRGAEEKTEVTLSPYHHQAAQYLIEEILALYQYSRHSTASGVLRRAALSRFLGCSRRRRTAILTIQHPPPLRFPRLQC